MQTYPSERIRNIGLFSHGGAGKTSLAEAMLFTSKAITRLGRVEDGNTVSDWDPDEVKRTFSISASLIPIEWNNHKLNVIDAPGYADFAGEVSGAMRVVDTAAILLDASAGVEVGAEIAWQLAQEQQRPVVLVVNRIDRENADYAGALASAQDAFGSAVVPLLIPIGRESGVRGVVNLLTQRAWLFGDGRDGAVSEADVPADMLDEVETLRLALVERIAENDEELMLRYLEDEPISNDELLVGLRTALANRDIVPVLTCAATTNRGVNLLLDALIDIAPAPGGTTATTPDGDVRLAADASAAPVALVWKTTADPYVGKLTYFRVYDGTVKADSHLWNVTRGKDERLGALFAMRGKEQIAVGSLGPGDIGAVAKMGVTQTGDTLADPGHQVTLAGVPFPEPSFSAAIAPHSKADLDKMGVALHRMMEEDPTLRVSRDPESAETIVSGLGESHVQISMERMARKFGVHVDISLPTVPYRETVQKAVKAVEYRHKKQTGGAGQFGHVVINVEPCTEEFEFAETIFGGSVPRQYIPAVEKGIRSALQRGMLAGFPVVNIRATLTDGSYHNVDSSDMAFQIAGSQALKKAVQTASPVLLEPVVKLCVTVPDSYTGDIMSDLATKRAHVSGMAPARDGYTTIEALAPAAEVQRYATDLRALTQGRGQFTTAFDHYQPVPGNLTDGIIAAHRSRLEHDS